MYAPTKEKEEDDKYSIYEELNHLWEHCSRHDVQIIVGNFNAKVDK